MKLTSAILALLFFMSACNPETDAPGPSDERRDEKGLLPEREPGRR